MHRIVGVDIGGTKIAGGIFTLQGELLLKETVIVKDKHSQKSIIQQLFGLIDNLLNTSNTDIKELKGIGICAPGPLNPKKGYIYNPPNLTGLSNFNLKDAVEAKYAVHCIVENDANAAAYAETIMGAAKGMENVFYVTVSTGVGTGIVINKRIYHGKNGFAGEGGHLSSNYHGDVHCLCGAPSCIEGIASGTAIAKKAKSLLKSDKILDSKLINYAYNDDQLTTEVIGRFAQKGDPVCIDIIQDAAFTIGAWLGGIINLLDPDIIVIGGGVSLVGDVFFEKVRSTALAFTYNLEADKTPIVAAQLQKDVGIVGASSLFLENFQEK